jgi:adenosylcobinamide kinase/adenosylcobinamide-phosphate guanylyltransferase
MERNKLITFVSGGARSGKSRFAEELAQFVFMRMLENYQKMEEETPQHMKASLVPNLIYLATAQAKDPEMIDRIDRHITQRGSLWQTIEEPYHISRVLRSCHSGDVILVDCLTIWLNNVMFDLELSVEMIRTSIKEWVRIVSEKELHVLFVSNDVNEGVPSTQEMVHQYMKVLEDVHCDLVQKADQAIQVVAGIPVYWKG